MVVSARCPGYYRLAPGEIVLEGQGRCIHCRQEAAIYQEEVKELTKSSSLLQLASGSDTPVRNLIIDLLSRPAKRV